MVDSKWESLSTDEKLDALRKDNRVLFDAINDATKRMDLISATGRTNFQRQAQMIDDIAARLKKVEATRH
jgi:hypothetical protein